MKVRIQKWETPLRIVFTRKYKNTKRPNISLGKNVILNNETKNNKCFYYWAKEIKIEEYDNFIKRFVLDYIERRQ
jgi:hypothetical protein